MSVTSELRPARTTPRLQLPVPGDAAPADYVSDTGALADAVDARAARVAAVVTALPAGPAEGDEILFRTLVGASDYGYWRFIRRLGLWEFSGGVPYAAAQLTGFQMGGDGTWFLTQSPAPWACPLSGTYDVLLSAQFDFTLMPGMDGVGAAYWYEAPAGTWSETDSVRLRNSGGRNDGPGADVATIMRTECVAGRTYSLIYRALQQNCVHFKSAFQVTPVRLTGG